MAKYLVLPVLSLVEGICENSWIKTTYLKKQTQFFPVFSPKTAFCQKQSQFKANFNPIQSQSKPFYAKRTQTSSFSAQKRSFHQKTNPKRTQTKPNCKTAKINLCPVLTRRYEKIRLYDRNENKAKTNPIFWLLLDKLPFRDYLFSQLQNSWPILTRMRTISIYFFVFTNNNAKY